MKEEFKLIIQLKLFKGFLLLLGACTVITVVALPLYAQSSNNPGTDVSSFLLPISIASFGVMLVVMMSLLIARRLFGK